MTADEVRASIDMIEEVYEFLLAFAAQGVRDDRQSPVGGQLRDFLERAANAVSALKGGLDELAESGALGPADAARQMAGVVARDAAAALAAVELVRAQPAISSQLVDNLNASIHLRALLTDLFIVDELLATG